MILSIILAIENEDDRNLMLKIYQECYPLMKSKAYKIVNDLHLADDVVQDAVIKLIDRLPVIRNLNKSQITAYVCRTVNSVAIDFYRRNMKGDSKIKFSPYADLADELEDDSMSPHERYEKMQEYEMLGTALLQLSERDKDLLYYKYYLELSDKEIAYLLDMEHTNVRVSLNRARKRAKTILSKAGGTV